MSRYDYHVHSSFSDGNNTIAEIAANAYAMGIKVLGFSDHSPYPFPSNYAMTDKNLELYRQETHDLAAYYRGRMTILCGIELDIESKIDVSSFDYRIGSVHCLRLGKELRDVDSSPRETRRMIREYFDNDPYRYAEAYFLRIADLSYRQDIDIIGHFDLLTKFEEKEPLWNHDDVRYKNAWKNAVEALLPLHRPFEINSGAISRGWRTTPYPSLEILRFLREQGADIILNSDSHDMNTLCYHFDQAKEIARTCGFTSRIVLTERGMQELPL